MPESREKRTSERVGLKVFVDEVRNENEQGLCRAVNVSETGMYLLRVSGKRPKPNRFAWLGFRLPDGGESIRALVEVVHRATVGSLEASGVRFKYLCPADRRRLDSYLAEKAVA